MKDENPYFNQNITCDVHTCNYNNCECNKCSLSEIKVSNSNKEKTLCASYEKKNHDN